MEEEHNDWMLLFRLCAAIHVGLQRTNHLNTLLFKDINMV